MNDNRYWGRSLRGIFACAAGFVAVGLVANAPAVEEIIDRVVAVVGRDVILRSEVDEFLQMQYLEAGLDPTRIDPAELATRGCEIVRSLVDDRLLVSKARLDSVDLDPQEVEERLRAQFEQVRSRFPTEQAFRDQLEREGTSERELRNRLRKQMERYMLRERLLAEMSQGIAVSFRELEQFYEDNRDSLPTLPATVTIAHITRISRPGDSSLVAARERIALARQRIEEGESFGDVAREVSEDPGTAPTGGDLGWFGRGEMVPEFEAIAFSLDSGAVSGAVLTEFGLHLIQNLGFRDNQVWARHILARAQPTQIDQEATRDTLISLYERIQSGEEFGALARQYSMDPNVREMGGRIGPVSPQDLPAPFGRALATLEAGQVSYPFESTGGTYHIVKLISRTREHRMNLTDDRRQLEDGVRQQKLVVEVEKILERERRRTYVDVRMPECSSPGAGAR